MDEPPIYIFKEKLMSCVRLKDKSTRIASIALSMLGAAGLLAGVIPAQAQTFNVLYNFQGYNAKDGAQPVGLVKGPNGYLYGTTASGGAVDAGTVFRIGPGGGNYEIMWSFGDHINAIDGDGTAAPLVLANNGTFYGTTLINSGGGSGNGSDGVVFRITPAGALTPIHNFCDVMQNDICVGGVGPQGAMMQARKGYLFTGPRPAPARLQSRHHLYNDTGRSGGHLALLLRNPRPGNVC